MDDLAALKLRLRELIDGKTGQLAHHRQAIANLTEELTRAKRLLIAWQQVDAQAEAGVLEEVEMSKPRVVAGGRG